MCSINFVLGLKQYVHRVFEHISDAEICRLAFSSNTINKFEHARRCPHRSHSMHDSRSWLMPQAQEALLEKNVSNTLIITIVLRLWYVAEYVRPESHLIKQIAIQKVENEWGLFSVHIVHSRSSRLDCMSSKQSRCGRTKQKQLSNGQFAVVRYALPNALIRCNRYECRRNTEKLNEYVEAFYIDSGHIRML